MKAKEIEVGGHYVAKVNGKLTTVRVDSDRITCNWRGRSQRLYDVTNLTTRRKTTFRSAQRFRGIALSPETVKADVAHAVERVNR